MALIQVYLGEVLALLSALCFACSNVFVSKGSTGKGDRGVIFSVLVTLVFSLLLWLTVGGATFPSESRADMLRGIFWFSVAGVFAMVFGRTFIYASLRYLGVTRASSLKKLTPFFSVILAYVLLSEAITALDMSGMALIGLAFAMLTVQSLRKLPPEERAQTPRLKDYSWGVGASASYAMSMITRKFGLAHLASPALGTLIGAVVGFAFYLVAACFSERYRSNLRNLFRNLNGWLVLAAVFMSSGQITVFAALSYADVSTVAILGSLEVFLSSFLAVFVFKAEKNPGLWVYLAACLAVIGAVMVGYSPVP